jgi:hypothetical protein
MLLKVSLPVQMYFNSTVTLLTTSCSAAAFDLYVAGNPISLSGFSVANFTYNQNAVNVSITASSYIGSAGNTVFGYSNNPFFAITAEI